MRPPPPPTFFDNKNIKKVQKDQVETMILIAPTWQGQTTIIFVIFWDFLIFYQIFLSPQVKRYYK